MTDRKKPELFTTAISDKTGQLKAIATNSSLQIGKVGQPEELILTGRFSKSAHTITASPGNTYSTPEHSTILFIKKETKTAGEIYVILPASPRTGQEVIVKDVSGTAASSNIVISSANGERIDQKVSKKITTDYGVISFVWTNSAWTETSSISVSTNIQGPQGTSGAQGASGAVGYQGASGGGPQGVQGMQGALGTQGASGGGPQGVQGSKGVQGYQGYQGASGGGPQGYQGIQGDQGVQGESGVGIGIPGPQGYQGVQGNQGNLGVQGYQGVLGTQGAQGYQGVLGTQGTQGAQGAQGYQGVLGTQGYQGRQGYQGVFGTQGYQGVLGIQGYQGVLGIQGYQGYQGYQGRQGYQGVLGTQGYQGVAGTAVPGVGYTVYLTHPAHVLPIADPSTGEPTTYVGSGTKIYAFKNGVALTPQVAAGGTGVYTSGPSASGNFWVREYVAGGINELIEPAGSIDVAGNLSPGSYTVDGNAIAVADHNNMDSLVDSLNITYKVVLEGIEFFLTQTITKSQARVITLTGTVNADNFGSDAMLWNFVFTPA